ncbi:recombination mediator RecR [Spiroplasma endosymbiont of Labia minor]|uniref:recombination mediator RecR n=1 Tax=Spiroplasma endosymbiont of Labia minor TaxID=3066305 RepID=UPI0030CF71C5
MIDKFQRLEEIISEFREIDALGKKTTEKMIVSFIQNSNKLKKIKKILNDIENDFDVCQICFFFRILKECPFCDDKTRIRNQICVVPTISDALNIEKSKTFHGLFHILGGEIALNKNIGPEKLNIDKLFDRINKNEEIIIALNVTLDGEVTTNYIAAIAQNLNINITRLATGIPVGGMIDYLDDVTLQNAIKNRKKIRSD